MSAVGLVGHFEPDTLGDLAGPFIRAAEVVVMGYAVPDDYLPQAGLSLALQAVVNAAIDETKPSTQDVVAAYATAFASWATTIADNADEFEDAVIALARAVRSAGPSVLADRKAG